MARPRNVTPSYLLHSQTGRGRAVWTDAHGIRHFRMLPGEFNSQESLAAKARLELELATSPGKRLDDPTGATVAEVLAAYLDFAESYYTDTAGNPGKESVTVWYAMKPVEDLYADLPAVRFGPVALKAVRQRMIEADLSRGLINRRVNIVKRIFKWAASEELVPVTVYEALRTLAGLRFGRTSAREAEPIGPVADHVVDATLPFLPHHVRPMVELIRHTGMRPSEVCAMTLNQIERGTLWTYRPRRHKTAHHGKGRMIPLGPRAREVLSKFLAGRALDPDAPIFSPKTSREERFALMRADRKTKVQPSQANRRTTCPKKLPTDRYTPGVISRAIAVACDRAFPAPPPLAQTEEESATEWKARLTAEQQEQLKTWRREHRWHPYQLRHAFATRVRKEHGLEAAQVLLGHSRADVTQVYAERNEALATGVADKIG
jgi:integrase